MSKQAESTPSNSSGTALISEPPAVQIQFSAEFKSQLRSLAKRYRQIRSDLQPLIDRLQSGEFPGDQIPGTGFTVFKIRVKNGHYWGLALSIERDLAGDRPVDTLSKYSRIMAAIAIASGISCRWPRSRQPAKPLSHGPGQKTSAVN